MVFVAAAADDDNEPFYVLFGLGSYCTGARHMFIFFFALNSLDCALSCTQ